MYRSKKSGGQAAAALAVHADTTVNGTQKETPKVSSNASIVPTIMAFKTRLMAPFMFYDKTIRQIVPNPAHDRVLRSEVSRVQGVVLREFRRALESEASSTPKEMLYAVQKSVLLAYASCAVSHNTEALVPLTSDEDAVACMAQLENIFGERNACAKAVASLAAVLSTGIVRDIYKEACNRLEARLTAEEQSPRRNQCTKESQLALEATRKNTQDLIHLRDSLVTAFEAISVPPTENGTTPLPKSAAADATTTLLTIESYYGLLGWLLMVQPERLALVAAHSTANLDDASPEAEKLFAEVTSYDPATGKIVIERANSTSKWGLMLNASGELIGLENTLRNSTSAGGVLYQALQQSASGLQIFDINGVDICDGEPDADSANAKKARLGRIRGVLQESETLISLTVTKVTNLGKPQEVAFDIITQGGEGASGQQAVLILKRPSTGVQWQFKMRMRTEGVLILDEVADSLPLSEAARDFLSHHRGHLHIMHVNGCDTSHSTLLMDVVRSSLYLVLRLQVVGDMEQLVENVAMTTQGEEAKLEAVADGREGEAVETTAAATHEERETAEDEEAEVAHHRALLEEHNIHPDEPLPEVGEADDGSTLKKRGRPKKLTAAPAAIDGDDGDDAMITQQEEVHESPAEELEADDGLTRKKKGRPKKLASAATEAIDDYDAMPTQQEEVHESPADELEADDGATQKKRGRPKKLTAAAAEAIDDYDAMPTQQEEVHESPAEELEADDGLTQKKRGRPKKLASTAAEAIDDYDAMPTQQEEVHESPADELEADAATPLETRKSRKGVASSERTSKKKKALSKRAMKKAQKEAKMRAKEEKRKQKEMKALARKKQKEGVAVKESKDEHAADATRSLQDAAKAQGVFETPLVNLKSVPEAATEVVTKTKPDKNASPPPKETKDDALNHAVRPVSAAELRDAPPLTFENAVTLDRFDGSHMELRRPDLKTPWDMKVSLGGDKLVLTRLPPISAALKTHPFLKSLQPDRDGAINWCVDKVNGTDLTTASKTLRTKALESIKKANKISLVLRPLVK